jgi:hypothetical protein
MKRSCILIAIFISLGITAQTKLDSKIPTPFFYFHGCYKPTMDLFTKNSIKPSLPLNTIKPNLPPLPFFCDMEEKFRGKFNVFLKFRAGTDEGYRKLIRDCEHR